MDSFVVIIQIDSFPISMRVHSKLWNTDGSATSRTHPQP